MPRRDSIPAEPVADPERLAEDLVREHGASPEDYALAEDLDDELEPPHDSSLTAIAAETARTGVHPERALEEVPGQDDLLRAGDPGVDPLANLLSGEELPGASDPAPDQNDVDEIGRAAGLTAEDDDRLSGDGLRSPAELFDERDAHRWELDPRSSGRPGDDRPARKPR
jgi:hypothetical protein